MSDSKLEESFSVFGHLWFHLFRLISWIPREIGHRRQSEEIEMKEFGSSPTSEMENSFLLFLSQN